MKKFSYKCFGILAFINFLCIPTVAQITPDSSLPVNSAVTFNGRQFTINGGTVRGNNLFHSFSVFSIPSETTAFFNNPASIQIIFSRVTGNTVSYLNGTLQANSNASLFLINPSGIIFGPNARLNIGGSFLATTADAIEFSNGTQFIARGNTTNPLLTVAIPTGLIFRGRSGPIIVQGIGHNLRYLIPGSPVFSPILDTSPPTSGLTVLPGQTLALVGSNVTFDNGILSVPFGQIHIGSVATGKVSLRQTSQGFSFDYGSVSRFQDVQLSGKSLLNSTGFGQINITTNNLSLNDYSVILHSNFTNTPAGLININALESVVLSGSKNLFPPSGEVTSRGIISQNFSTGDGANINISAADMLVQNFTVVNSSTYGSGRGGNVEINLLKDLTIDGTPLIANVFLPSFINSNSFSSGQGGNIMLSGRNLSVLDGGLILAFSSSTGDGGNIQANFTNRITAQGSFPLTSDQSQFVPSVIGVLSSSTGSGGEISLKTKTLDVLDAGRINASTIGQGTGGNIFIDASESVNVQGGSLSNPGRVSQIIASADLPLEILRSYLTQTEPPSGKSGNIFINSKRLTVSDNGLINVRNDGSGTAGNLLINTDVLTLTNGELTASTASGNGGEVDLDVKSLSLLQSGSTITASAQGVGLGGNIRFNSPLLVVVDRSRISANAEQNAGGRINITTTGLYLSRDSQITATSQLGPQFNGVINIDTPDINLATQPQLGYNLSVASQPLTCIGQRGTNLSVITASDLDKSDDQLEAIARANNIPMFLDGQGRRRPLIEVQGWIPNGDGTARPIAVVENSNPSSTPFGTPCVAANE